MLKKIILSSILIAVVAQCNIFAAKFYLDPMNVEAKTTCPVKIKIMVDTQWQEITAGDMILRYNDKIFDINGFVPGNMFDINWGLKREPGRLRATATNSSRSALGVWEFGTLTITPKVSDKNTKIIFEIDKYGTTSTLDSNLAFEWKDFLNNVGNIKIHTVEWDCKDIVKTWNFVEMNKHNPISYINSNQNKETNLIITNQPLQKLWILFQTYKRMILSAIVLFLSVWLLVKNKSFKNKT